MRNGHARAAKIAECAQSLHCITDGFDLPGQIDKVETEFLKSRVVDGGREGMLDRISNHPAKLRRGIDLHRVHPLDTVIPPSIVNVPPVTQPASSDARYSTMFATSSGVPGRRRA